ncbi:alpha/beta fold hydrolase [Hyphomicrobium sp.]|uniref:alpha/beta fold hydrolase n=1 Tax=Hyphomicrobium sp. TaxID=82 RepID=UPI0025BAAD79|nr:alpha/beta fold hydrolase [Hyphomicrobium sp.]MCC7251213.1 alpha/beta fold hydrolase [Hyphomicrobium sp.]
MTLFFDRRLRTRPVRLDHLPPALAGDLAYRRFCLPKLSTRRSADHVLLAERARFHLRNALWVRMPTTEGEVQAYVFEPEGDGPHAGVLIAHGWTSEASFMAVFAEQLRRAGFRVVAFDQPGHGKSAQERASLIDCARALLHVAETLGPFKFAVTHSMGGLAALLVGEGGPPMARAYPFERYVLLSSPNSFSTITREFADELHLGPAATRNFERHLERVAHRPMATFTAANLLAATGRPALVIHARDDTEVVFRHAEEIAAACPKATLLAFDGLGHRNILFAPPVIRAALSYLSDG